MRLSRSKMRSLVDLLSPDGWTALATVLLVIVTAALVIATVALACMAYNQNATIRAQTRAYVFLKGGRFELQDGDRKVHVSIEIVNFGQTPGYDFETWSEIKVLPADADPFGETGVPMQRSIIGPSANLGVGAGPIDISNEDLAAVVNDEKRIFAWGYARYRDAFDRRWEFIFRTHNDPEKVRQWNDGVRGFGLKPHSKGYSEVRR